MYVLMMADGLIVAETGLIIAQVASKHPIGRYSGHITKKIETGSTFTTDFHLYAFAEIPW